jgi:biotin carboxyl carrier protein
LLNAAKNVDAKTLEDFKARQKLQVQSDLPARVDIANKELQSARISLELLQATAALGKVVCPKNCKIVKRYVTSGQYVTKGDPLVEIEIRQR